MEVQTLMQLCTFIITCDQRWPALSQQAASQMAELFIRSLVAASVVLQLPPERQPAEPGWDTLSSLSELLGCAPLRPAVLEQLQPPRSAAAVLRAAVQLLLRVPAPGAADGQASLENVCLRYGMCLLVQLALRSQPGAQLGAQAADQLWSMLPALRPLLHHTVQYAGTQDAAMQHVGMHVLCNSCNIWQDLVCWLSSWCDEQQLERGSAAIQPKHIAAAAGALQALPVLLAATELQQQQQQQQLALNDLDEHEAAATLAGEIMHLCFTATRLLVDKSHEERMPPLSTGSSAAAWQLHTTACRAAHWLAADPSRRQLLPCLQQPAELCVTMSGCLEAARRLCNSSEAGLPASRELHAMGMAQAAALHTLLACAEVHIDGGTALEGLSTAYAAGPPAMTLQPGVGDSFLACLGRLPEVGACWLLRSLQAVCTRCAARRAARRLREAAAAECVIVCACVDWSASCLPSLQDLREATQYISDCLQNAATAPHLAAILATERVLKSAFDHVMHAVRANVRAGRMASDSPEDIALVRRRAQHAQRDLKDTLCMHTSP